MASFQTSFPPLTFTGNTLQDVIELINGGNVIALYTSNITRVFHSINFDFKQTTITESLKTVRVLYMDCNGDQDLLCDGEWEWFIKKSVKDVKELAENDDLRKVILEPDKVPNKEFIVVK